MGGGNHGRLCCPLFSSFAFVLECKYLSVHPCSLKEQTVSARLASGRDGEQRVDSNLRAEHLHP